MKKFICILAILPVSTIYASVQRVDEQICKDSYEHYIALTANKSKYASGLKGSKEDQAYWTGSEIQKEIDDSLKVYKENKCTFPKLPKS
jgi:hypothetical protein